MLLLFSLSFMYVFLYLYDIHVPFHAPAPSCAGPPAAAAGTSEVATGRTGMRCEPAGLRAPWPCLKEKGEVGAGGGAPR